MQFACGRALFRLKRHAEAVPHFERVVRSRPRDQWASLCLFHSLFKSERWEDAANEVMRFGTAGGESMEYRRLARDIGASELAENESGQSTSNWWILLRNKIYGLRMNYRGVLLNMVVKLLSGEFSLPQFRNDFYDFYIEKVPEDVMSGRDYEFFGRLQEKLDWTDEEPSDNDKLWGWLTYEDYRDWAGHQVKEYLADEEL
jgi:hypothetical protein